LWLTSGYSGLRDDNKGATAVFVHSSKGMALCRNVGIKESEYLDLDKILKTDSRKIIETVPKDIKYNSFWEDYTRYSFDYLINKYLPETRKVKIKYAIKNILNKSGLSKKIFKGIKKKIITEK
jgi:hypothetical protein